MSTNQTGNDPTEAKTSVLTRMLAILKRIPIVPLVAIISLMVAILVFLFGNNIVQQRKQSNKENTPPRFEISAINTLTRTNVYEVTNNMLWFSDSTTQTLNLNMGLEVTPRYSGDPLGEVQVAVKNEDGKVVARDSWKSFDKSAGPLQVKFTSGMLNSFVDLQQLPYQEDKGNYVYPKADMVVEVSRVSDLGHPLYTDTLTILNTPWYHFAKAFPSFLRGGIRAVDVFIKGRNLGAPSEFMILAESWVVTDTTRSPSSQYNPWPKDNFVVEEIGKVERDAEFSARVTLSGDKFKFEPGKCYAIKTFAIKEQPYVEFQNAEWNNSFEAWRFGDWEDWTMVCAPTQ